VSGGIFAHNIEYLHHILPEWPTIIKEFIFGLIGGALALILMVVIKKVLLLFKKN
jgi:uncharacterized membrane protein